MNWNEEINSVAKWMRDYAEEAGMKGYVVGLSGGLDSSVTACLAVKAVGVENVIGISLPCDSSPDAFKDAKELAKNLGIQFTVFDFKDTFLNLYNFGGSFFGIDVSKMTQANLKARLRMTILYTVANEINYLVAGTGNLSELEVGYATKYGDGGVDIEPIGNYYKTEVYKMAEHMPEIPENTKTKPPSADLWEGQIDEDELGMTYEELDILLQYIKAVDSGAQGEEEIGIPEAVLNNIPSENEDKVRIMKKRAIHKNNPPPRYIRRYVAVS